MNAVGKLNAEELLKEHLAAAATTAARGRHE